jgi:hypothetical protein
METATALAAKLDCSTAEQKSEIRTGIIQQLRTAFAGIMFSPHAIVGLIELPKKRKSMKGAFGLPKPISVKPTDDGERYFHRQMIFHDHPER